MKTLCLKSVLVGAAVVLLSLLAMGAGSGSDHGRYQITSVDGRSAGQVRVFVLDTRTGIVKRVDLNASGRQILGYAPEASGPFPVHP